MWLMADILTPDCPLCRKPPVMMIGSQAFCGNADCHTLCWEPSKSLDDNLLGAQTVHIPPMTGEDADG